MPRRAYISRDGDHGPVMHEVPGVIASEPHVGGALQIFLDNGKILRTSAVKRVARNDSELVVDTANSRYRLVLAEAA